MMTITRTHSQIEFGLGGARSVIVDVACITGAMLSAERMPSGHINHTLLLLTGVGEDPIRIEGDLMELAEAHCYVVETMADEDVEYTEATLH